MRVSEALLRLAARRWPAAMRDEMLRTWLAELHVLARQGKRLAMLAFSVSLLLSRPERPHVTALTPPKPTGFLVLFWGPAASVAAFVACLALGVIPVRLWVASDAEGDLLLFTVAALAASALMVRLGLRWGAGSTLGGPGATVMAVALTAPVVPVAIGTVIASVVSTMGGVGSEYVIPLTVWWPQSFAVLACAARLAATGRAWAAWLTGGPGMMLAIGLAVLLQAQAAEVPVSDALVGSPHALIVLSAYALSYVIGAARKPGMAEDARPYPASVVS